MSKICRFYIEIELLYPVFDHFLGGNCLSQNLVRHTSRDTSFVCGQMVDIFWSKLDRTVAGISCAGL